MTKKNLLVKGLVLKAIAVLILVSFPALVSAEIVEFQIDSKHLGELVQLRLKGVHICPRFLNYKGEEYILDLIDFPAGSRARPAPGLESVKIGDSLTALVTPAQLVVPVRLGLKTPECMDDPACGDEHTLEEEFNLIFSLTVPFEGGHLCAEFIGSDTPFPIPQDVIDHIPSRICAPLEINALNAFVDGNMAVIGVGIAADQQGRLAVRFEYSSAPNPIANYRGWQTFFKGSFSPTAPGADWSMFVSKELIMQKIERLLKDNLKNVDSIILGGNPRLSWLPAESFAQIGVEMPAEYRTKLCPNIDIDIEVDISLHLADNFLVIDGNIGLDKDLGDSVLCAVTWAAPALLFGPGFYGAVSAAFTSGIMNYEPGIGGSGGGCESTGDSTFSCKSPLEVMKLDLEPDILSSPYGILHMDYMKSHKDGLILYGGFQLKNAFNASRRRLSGSGGLRYGIYGSCSSLSMGYNGSLSLDGIGRLCSMEIIGDSLGVYRVDEKTANVWLPLSYPIVFNAPEDDGTYDKFFDNPYPLRLRVYTTAGAETFVLDPPPDRRQFDEIELRVAFADAKVNCLFLVDRFAGLFWWEWQMRTNYQREGVEEVYKGRINIAAGMEFRMNRNFCLLVSAGYGRFKGNSGTFMNMINASLNGKLYLKNRGEVKIFINAGPGYYSFDPGKNNFGFNIGGGLQYQFSKRFVLEASYNFNNIFRSGKDEKLSSIRTGIRIRF